jgi:hypothetical protein
MYFEIGIWSYGNATTFVCGYAYICRVRKFIWIYGTYIFMFIDGIFRFEIY